MKAGLQTNNTVEVTPMQNVNLLLVAAMVTIFSPHKKHVKEPCYSGYVPIIAAKYLINIHNGPLPMVLNAAHGHGNQSTM